MSMNNNGSKNPFGGVIGGILLIIVGIGLLWYNEGRTVGEQKGISEAKDKYVQVKSDKIDSKYDNKLIATNGKLDISNSNELVDSDFNIKIKSAKMTRTVEMYQWDESCTTDDNNVEKCDYKKEWEDSVIDSSDFKKSGHDNPNSMPYESKIYVADNVKMGAYSLPNTLLERLSTKKTKTGEELREEFANKIADYKIEGEYITSQVEEEPQIGDIRIKFDYNDADSVSVLAVQTGTTLTSYVPKTGSKIYKIKEGIHTGDEIIQDLIDENNTIKWIFRLLGTVLVMIGIGSIFSPINKLANFIPIVGGVVGVITGLVSILAGLAISLVVIALAWFRFRPLLSISLLAIVVVCIILLFVLKKKNNKE